MLKESEEHRPLGGRVRECQLVVLSIDDGPADDDYNRAYNLLADAKRQLAASHESRRFYFYEGAECFGEEDCTSRAEALGLAIVKLRERDASYFRHLRVTCPLSGESDDCTIGPTTRARERYDLESKVRG